MLDFTYEGNPAELPGLTLAYIGDAVYELYVRQQVLQQSVKAHNLHYLAVKRVNNNTQAALLLKVEPELTETERSVARRGRNAKGIVPKNADVQTYRKSTGLEALVGYLYLKHDEERLHWLLNQIEEVVAHADH
ncbi:MAG: ribonuclease III [Peptococcaceae bacterium]|nr:ribonuclease III [Peptococcaceae bacterium]